MIILLIGGLAALATGIVASLTGNDRFMEHVMLARMARESNRRKPRRGAKWILKEPILLEQHRPTRQK